MIDPNKIKSKVILCKYSMSTFHKYANIGTTGHRAKEWMVAMCDKTR